MAKLRYFVFLLLCASGGSIYSMQESHPEKRELSEAARQRWELDHRKRNKTRTFDLVGKIEKPCYSRTFSTKRIAQAMFGEQLNAVIEDDKKAKRD